jgi:hypothetical protein
MDRHTVDVDGPNTVSDSDRRLKHKDLPALNLLSNSKPFAQVLGKYRR